MKATEIDKIVTEVEKKGDSILWNKNHWAKKTKWEKSSEYGIIATSDNRYNKLKYNTETGVLELANKYMTGIGTSKGEYFTTIEKGLTNEQAFEKWIEIISK